MAGRNDPCPCGSGKKYKKCCANQAISSQAVPPITDPNMIMTYMNSGQWAAAINALHSYLPSEPNNPALYEMLGVAQYQSGELQQAANNFLKQIQLSKNDAQAHKNLAQVLFEQGNNEDASLYCQRAIQLDKNFDAAHNCLGNIYRAAGHLKQAEQSYQSAIKLNKSNPYYYCNLGVVEQELGQYTDAEKQFAYALKMAPDFTHAMNNYAAVMQMQCKHADAIELYKKVLSLEPGNVEAMNNLGTCYLDLGDMEQAKSLFKKAIACDANHIDAYVNLGFAEIEANNLEQAKRWVEQALMKAPDNSNASYGQGLILLKQDQILEAEQYFNQALKSNPNNSKAIAGLASCLLKINKRKSALSLIKKALALSPNDSYVKSVEAYLYESMALYNKAENIWHELLMHEANRKMALWGLSQLYMHSGNYLKAEKIFIELSGEMNEVYMQWAVMEEKRNNLELSAELLSKVEKTKANETFIHMHKALLERRSKNYEQALSELNELDINELDGQRIKGDYYFEKGRCLDKLKRYDEAFTSFQQANAYRSMLDKSDKSFEKSYVEYKTFFNHDRQKGWSFNGYHGQQKPVFIVGFPRSGTTLLEQILSSHSRVTAGDELAYIQNITRFSVQDMFEKSKDYPFCLENITQEKVEQLRNIYLDSARNNGIIHNSTEYFTDKMPHNLAHLGLINLLFPDSPIIHIMRHPLDSCLSAFMSNFTKGHNYLRTIEDTAHHFADLMQLGKYYKENLDLNIMTLRYEDLVEEQESNTHMLLDFVGLEWEEACLEFHKNKRVARTASYEQVTQKIYTSSKFRYKNYYEQLESVFPILEKTINYYGYSIEPK